MVSKIQQPPKLSVSINKEYQLLMLPIFNKEMGHWHGQLGKEIDSVIQNVGCSKLLKAVLLYFFFRSFDVSKEAIAMRAFYPTYQKLG